jgi:hypothetical protein
LASLEFTRRAKTGNEYPSEDKEGEAACAEPYFQTPKEEEQVKKSLIRMILVAAFLVITGSSFVMADGPLPLCTPTDKGPCGGGTNTTRPAK